MERQFIFSRNALSEKQALARKADKIYAPGTVVVNGKIKYFTEMLSPGKKSRFDDATIVTTGDTTKIRYTPESYT